MLPASLIPLVRKPAGPAWVIWPLRNKNPFPLDRPTTSPLRLTARASASGASLRPWPFLGTGSTPRSVIFPPVPLTACSPLTAHTSPPVGQGLTLTGLVRNEAPTTSPAALIAVPTVPPPRPPSSVTV